MAYALLASLIILPALLVFLLKSNGALSFLALCGGFMLVTLSGSDIEHLIGKTKITSLTSNVLDLILLVVPLLLTLLLTFRAVPNKRQLTFQLLPALAAGLLLAAIAAPMFNQAINVDFSKILTWRVLQQSESYIAGIGLLFSLALIWAGGFGHARSHKSKKH